MKFRSIPEMIRDRAAKYQNKEVFRYADRKSNKILSKNWNELLSDFTRLSKALRSRSFGLEDKIGIFSSNCPEWTITDLAILNIRAIVVPFFSTASRLQCKYIVDETEMQLMFVGDQEQLNVALWLLENTDTLKTIVVFNPDCDFVDNRCIHLSDLMKENFDSKLDPKEMPKQANFKDISTIIYTSGTTGEPKGVMLNNENFMYAFEIHRQRLDLNERDISLCFLPLSHIFERCWTFYLLYCGGTNFYLHEPKDIVEYLQIARPTVMCTVLRLLEKVYEGIQTEKSKWSTIKRRLFNWSIGKGSDVSNIRKTGSSIPGLLNLQYKLADKLVLNKLRKLFGGNLRSMPCSGAALPTHLLKFFHACGIFVNYGYGATETTATVSCFQKDKYEFESCGTIMPGLELKISDHKEILVKGKTIFQAYYKKPEETARVLKNGWYHTGDEGRMTDQGNLLMTDRLKDLMKTSGGKYISPQKLETLLGQESFVEQLIVVGDNRKYVTAVIVPVMDHLHELANKLELKFNNARELFQHHQIRKHLKERIDQLQFELSNYEKIKDFILLSEPFSIENNTLTSTLKTRRKAILELYAHEIDAMY
jgi:long-chain acyl-CoA synthetase